MSRLSEAIHQAIHRLPVELPDQIREYLPSEHDASTTPAVTTSLPKTYAHPAEEPPKNKKVCKIMDLPTEIRQDIFAHELAARNVEYKPHCCENSDECRHDETESDDAKDKTPPKLNRTSDLMVLNKKIRDEIATTVYEERFFTIHVHEGIKHGGVEFLHSGRQKLQYQDDVIDDFRFEKFKHREDFGFDRLKKIKITVFPPNSDEPSSRHTQLNTFFMHQALCQLLKRSEEKNRISKIEISFAIPSAESEGLVGRRAISKAENYLWDPDWMQPLARSIHEISDIEIILRPFSELKCHNVEITLPPKVCDHGSTYGFVKRLKETMLSTEEVLEHGSGLMDDQSAAKIRALGADLRRYILDMLHAKGKGISVDVPDLGYDAMEDDDDDDATKHGLSPISQKHGGDEKRLRREPDDEVTGRSWEDDLELSDDEKDMQKAVLASYKQEQEDLERAIQASMDHRAREPDTGSSSREPKQS